jgi:hypothetical protein
VYIKPVQKSFFGIIRWSVIVCALAEQSETIDILTASKYLVIDRKGLNHASLFEMRWLNKICPIAKSYSG